MAHENDNLACLHDMPELRALELTTAAGIPQAAATLQRHLAGPLLGYLDVDHTSSSNSLAGCRILLFEGERCVAMGTVHPAELGPLPKLTGLDEAMLSGSVGLGEVFVEQDRQSDLLPILLYLLFRRARVWERQTVVSYVPPYLCGSDADVVHWERLQNLAMSNERRPSASILPVAQRLDIAIHKAYQASGARGQAFLRTFFVPEAVETLEIHIDRFFQTDFFRAVYESTLSREQYVYSMSNLHQFVRYTTRLIGRAVSLSNDEVLRNHWLSHLSGEINHEKIIEKDLEALGADVDYVVNHMVPNVHNQQFMVTQESAIGFYQDPVLFMAAPFAAEGWTARLDARFMDALHKAALGWGIKNPRHVTGFLSSHINYDGGEDGHWETSRKILGRYLTDDRMLQRFLNLLHLAMNAFERSYTSYVTEQRLWSAIPTRSRSTSNSVAQELAVSRELAS